MMLPARAASSASLSAAEKQDGRGTESPATDDIKSLTPAEADEGAGCERALAVDTALAARDYTGDDFKRLVRKQDRFLLPLMWVAYGVQVGQLDTPKVLTELATLSKQTRRGSRRRQRSVCFHLGAAFG